MAEFMLEPEEIESEPRTPYRATRVVSTGIAPTATVPTSRKPAPAPCHVPCADCGQMVLRGTAAPEEAVQLDLHIATYTVVWAAGTPGPSLTRSRAYPVHQCTAGGD